MTDRNLGAGSTSDGRLLARVWDWSDQAIEPIDAAAIARSTAAAANAAPTIGRRLRASLPSWRSSGTARTTERMLLVVVLLGLLVVAFVGASLQGTRLPENRDSRPM